MGYVKMPQMLSSELLKALAGNVYNVKEEPKHEDEMAAAWKEYLKPEKKSDKREEDVVWPDKKCDKKEEDVVWPDKKRDDDCCCPKKVKFIFVLNNTVVINVNAACEEDAPCA